VRRAVGCIPKSSPRAAWRSIFFLHGVALSFAAMRAGVLNWRLHVLVQVCTYAVLPVLGIVLNAALGSSVAPELKLGLFFSAPCLRRFRPRWR
jgi:sodium/bile acid cotransporter 7